MRKLEDLELITKAAVHLKGKWPDGYKALIVSTKKNNHWGDGHFQSTNFDRTSFAKAVESCKTVESRKAWKWVCTQKEYEGYMKILSSNAPKGATHYLPNNGLYYVKENHGYSLINEYGIQRHAQLDESAFGKLIPLSDNESVKETPDDATHTMTRIDGGTNFLKDVDNHTLTCSVWSCGVWESDIRYFLDDDINEIINEPAEWTPEVGQSCQVLWYNNWHETFIVGKDSDGDLVYEISNFSEIGSFETADSTTQFRPIPPENKVDPVSDEECPYFRIRNLGDQLHNILCELQDEPIVDELENIVHELWKTMKPSPEDEERRDKLYDAVSSLDENLNNIQINRMVNFIIECKEKPQTSKPVG